MKNLQGFTFSTRLRFCLVENLSNRPDGYKTVEVVGKAIEHFLKHIA
ncbi:hypothetical protein HMPREF9446_02284 [Bacteroides fluxus YIT 12057]|uniref:Uncharacterized protein n=1 Tax=Bacteroides fluxus YIT 12057 TaxID=763034 RepID=F3PU63_9BACE|nr:hypothetical protein HMPREF9446_02284 [Bacteroides fluxus YIT 12057]